MAGILVEKVFKQYCGLLANEDHVNELVPQLEAKLGVYDTILSKEVRSKRRGQKANQVGLPLRCWQVKRREMVVHQTSVPECVDLRTNHVRWHDSSVLKAVRQIKRLLRGTQRKESKGGTNSLLASR